MSCGGGGSSTAANTAEAHLAAVANATCRVGTLISDLAARRGLLAETRKLPRKEGNVANTPSLLDKFYRLDVKIQADLKALGLTSCIGPRPRKPIGG